jgi:single-strand DNA-binding protein
MLNKAILMGRFTKDPELRYTQNSTPVCTFSIAVERDYTPQGGQKQTDFIDIVAWRKTAEFICKYFSKGRMIVVCGSIQRRTWEGTVGRKNYATEIIGGDVYFGDSKRDNNNDNVAAYYPASPAPSAPATFAEPAGAGFEAFDDAGAGFDSVPPAPPSTGDFVPIDTDDDLPF